MKYKAPYGANKLLQGMGKMIRRCEGQQKILSSENMSSMKIQNNDMNIYLGTHCSVN